MLSRILLAVVGALAGGIFVSAASAAGPDDDVGVDAASFPLPELTVAPPTDYPDVKLFNGYAYGNQAAFNRADPRRLVVGIEPWAVTECYVKRSADGGRTWGAPLPLPQFAGAQCSDEPAVAYAAGGGRLYAAYPYIKRGLNLSGVAFSLSTDQGASWSTPINVLPERDLSDGGFYRDVRLAAAPDGGRLYVAAFWEDQDLESGAGSLTINFSSSGNQGLGWTPGKMIAQGDSTQGTYIWGFALAAGRGGTVLVAYAWERRDPPNYKLQVASSADHGVSFLYGTADQSDELYYYMHDPDIKIGPFGTAHLVYAKIFNGGRAILYKYSFPPYSSWNVEPVRLDDDDLARVNLGNPRLALGACGKASVLHATWQTPSKILYTRKVAQPGYAWSEPLKVGVITHGIFDNGLAAAGPKAFSIFRDEFGWGIAGSRVSSGVTCP